jgi:hypothetical protein
MLTRFTDSFLREKMMKQSDWDNRVSFHPANTQERMDNHAMVREVIRNAGDALNFLPEGREKSVVYTKLEEAMFWANAAVARQPND